MGSGERATAARVILKLELGLAHAESFDPLHEATPVGAPPKLPVRHDLEAGALLERNRLLDGPVLKRGEVRRSNSAVALRSKGAS